MPRASRKYVALEARLRALGYTDGGNVAFEFVGGTGEMTPTVLQNALAESVRRSAEVILVGGPEWMLRAAVEAARDAPIGMVAIDYDPLKSCLSRKAILASAEEVIE